MDYKKLAKEIVEHIGGIENITQVEHCATRLRLTFIKKELIDEEAIKSLEGVIGVVLKATQLQIIIGPNVHKAYVDFLDVSGFEEGNIHENNDNDKIADRKDAMYYVQKFGDYSAAIFMPIIPALIAGGLILSVRNLLVNYFSISMDSGTAVILTAVFDAGFSFIPIYLGFTAARTLKLEPVMGAFLGCLLVSPLISGIEGLNFLGISIPTVNYSSSVMPVIMGVILMYFVNQLLQKYIPELLKYFLIPLLTMIIVVPITLIVLGPLGTILSNYVGIGITWLMDKASIIATPIFSALYPYMVMLGLDKALIPIAGNSFATIGYDPVTMAMGYVSNLCIGGTVLAMAMNIKDDKKKRGMTTSFAATALCGVTEPAFYGALITHPKMLLGTAIGAISGGLVAGIFTLKAYVMSGCPGLLSALFFIPEDGSLGNLIVACVTAVVSISVSFIATTIILKNTKEKI